MAYYKDSFYLFMSIVLIGTIVILLENLSLLGGCILIAVQ
jgi:hypothetical protein